LSEKHYREANVRLTSRDVADYCQVSKSTVLGWIKGGKLESFKLPSGHHRIDKDNFRQFLERWHMPVRENLFGSGTGTINGNDKPGGETGKDTS